MCYRHECAKLIKWCEHFDCDRKKCVSCIAEDGENWTRNPNHLNDCCPRCYDQIMANPFSDGAVMRGPPRATDEHHQSERSRD